MPTVALCNVGSRGDLQPLCALGLEFKSRGWHVAVLTEKRAEPLVREFGLEARVIAGDSVGIIFEEKYADMLAKGKLFPMMQEMQKRKRTWQHQTQIDLVEGTKDADIIVSGPLLITESYCIAEKRQVPWIPVIYGAVFPTSEYPNPFVTESNWFGWLNRLSYDFLYFALWQHEKTDINKFRAEQLELGPMKGYRGVMTAIEEKNLLSIGAFHQCAIPSQKRPKDWPESIFFSNFFFVPPSPESAVSNQLKAFFAEAEEGSATIYMGLGSMPAPDPQALLDIAQDVVEKLEGVRALVCAGWSDLLPDGQDKRESGDGGSGGKKLVWRNETTRSKILVVRSVPHDYIFPK
uniref:Glycosyltransferase family 28 N-terminal domain-containing protein n=1 Tax=Chromera velia CCMP2878 TaxID=1169474 RepID=A0A0G4IFB0_9ALVE|eukprot:Cvel_14002.t1-p1 / transcript=Cvel_14002.t1 / gene=Cvel_14002 / organism=Chromera_velia_CCMP2878 / gene_product=Sterol 3-beta-glucosyltransferase, putative / transcript_product=Sterol 3-beta-glucosyltransferase, putative / location=Cvel_scaffold979:58409-59452(+) / protein_length=348 / sequence_SO=supercontig / SO=protein_coding / is_pseudo=false